MSNIIVFNFYSMSGNDIGAGWPGVPGVRSIFALILDTRCNYLDVQNELAKRPTVRKKVYRGDRFPVLYRLQLVSVVSGIFIPHTKLYFVVSYGGCSCKCICSAADLFRSDHWQPSQMFISCLNGKHGPGMCACKVNGSYTWFVVGIYGVVVCSYLSLNCCSGRHVHTETLGTLRRR